MRNGRNLGEEDEETMGLQGVTEVYVWGNNRFGQLGLGEKYKGQVLELPKFCSFNLTISSVSCGSDFTAFITLKGHIYSMGSNSNGALGIGGEGLSVPMTSSPLLVESLCNQRASNLSCGSHHAVVVMEDGRAYSWGLGEDGQTSLGNFETTSVPSQVVTQDSKEKEAVFFMGVACGTKNSALITREGQVYLSGDNRHGQLANGRTGKENKAAISPHLNDKITSVAFGDSHVLFLSGIFHSF